VRRAFQVGRPLHVHNSACSFDSLIPLLLPAFVHVSRRGLPQPSCKHEDGPGGAFGHGGIASFGSPPSSLGPARQSCRKPLLFSGAGRANRLGPSGRQGTTWRIEPPPMRPPIRSPHATWEPGSAGDKPSASLRITARLPRQSALPASPARADHPPAAGGVKPGSLATSVTGASRQ
jgi:hypothetical protein